MIRKMTKEDLPVIDKLEKELFSSPWPMSMYVSEMTSNPFAHVCVLEEEGEIIGYFDWWNLYDNAQIATIGVRKEYQGKGYGQKMMDYIIQEATSQGCENLSLEVRVSNEKAISLYEKNGFLKVNIRKNYYEDNHEDAFLMVKPLEVLE